MKKYEELIIEMILLINEDVITTSPLAAFSPPLDADPDDIISSNPNP